ncbi:hypothetical protein [Leptolyngbya sp. 7M]|uniref:hypothetical protein n=1 Tax=Leptolyngbya sp. 7M TaxID=2812896 RepID=UPI001B8CB474|nr:hypothetical protein [Leptolyngbya sp. 7M]QYO62133.1 hypothetical protein JVX88_18630 [Leptolyngbya sp. 7M]
MANLVGTSADNLVAAVSGEHQSNGFGVLGKSNSGVGVWGVSETYEGMHAETKSTETAAFAAYNNNPDSGTAAVFGEKKGEKGHAGFFVGNVYVSRNLVVEGDVTLPNADFAEDFCVLEHQMVEPGTVMVLCDNETLQPSNKPYDKRVAGVVSGAGTYKPAIILDRREETIERKPLALVGKVYCKVDASYAPIEVGDLLTTSATLGHAMKATDPSSAFGAVIGKALRALSNGQGTIPILIALQ